VNTPSATHTYPAGPATYHLCLYTGLVGSDPCEICNDICVNSSTAGTGHKPTQVSNINAPSNLDISSIYPNPATNDVNIELTSTSEKDVVIKIYDVTGRLMSETNKHLSNGKQTVKLSVETLTDGIYNIDMIDGQNTIRNKFVKE